MELLGRYENIIKSLVDSGKTYSQISQCLRNSHPGVPGLSDRSIRRFCKSRNIQYRSHLTTAQLDCIVTQAVRSVGHSYGRKTIQGLLRSKGIRVGQIKIGESLSRVAPHAMSLRRGNVHRLINPPPYYALSYGEKVHLDQNEKLARFGVTHVAAIDGYSRKIVGFITIPRKNAIAIYHALFKPMLINEGLWEQVRVDHGREFALIITIQKELQSLRRNSNHRPVLQSMSTQNHRVERLWPEINQRINYPIKRILVMMESAGELDLSNDKDKFSVSWVTITVLSHPLSEFVQAWNHHRIAGSSGGIPIHLACNNNSLTPIPSTAVPQTNQLLTYLDEMVDT